MTFISLSYAVFLAVLLLCYWLVQGEKPRLWLILIASLLFYGTLQVAYIPLLLIGTWVNFRLGQTLDSHSQPTPHATKTHLSNREWDYAQADWNQRRQWTLAAGIALNVLLLVTFKYVPFFLKSLGQALQQPQVQAWGDSVGQSLIAPLGLSFFCFECIAYLVDVFRGAPSTPSLLRFSAYKFFFPKLISGPISRYHAVAIQWRTLQRPTVDRVAEGLWLIARGAAKKGILADQLGILVKLSFDESLQRAGSQDIWITTLAYGLQLYLDFSGYVDMARGSAQLLGITLPQNFDAPYLSTSIADFWRRWHMTLGDWLRNYLYFPLGGSRRGLLRTCLNLLVIMLIAGLWHGAAWGFIVWGLIHGLALAIHRLNDSLGQRLPFFAALWSNPLGTIVGWGLTQLVVFGGWLFFRLPDLNLSWWAISHLWGQSADSQFVEKVYGAALGLDREQTVFFLGAIILGMGCWYACGRLSRLQLSWPLKLGLVPLLLYAVWQLAPAGALPYIYFDF
jgi:alginate O-acetyltransferase complex protein AlgI